MEHGNGKREQPAGQPQPVRRKRKKKSALRRVLGVFKGLFLTLWTVLLVGVGASLVGLHFFKQYVDTTLAPALEVRAEDYTMNLSSFIYYQDKETGAWKELQSVHGEENRILVDFDEMSDYLWQAAVSIEDERFFEHQGVDWKSTARAVYQLVQGDSSRGGSTITQQVLKNMTEDDKPYVNRKIREIFRALEFEKNYRKEQILELYLNFIYLGQHCYGVQTAAQYYFGKDAKDLSLAESASLIAITNNPSLYGPMYDITYTRKDGTKITPRELNKERQGWVLDKMAEVINPDTGLPYITEAQRDAAKAEVLHFADGSTSADDIVEAATGKIEINSWFVDQVLRDVSADLAAEYKIDQKDALKRLYNSGFKIYTTLDPEIQSIAESVYEDRSNLDVTSRSGQKIQSGITIIDPYTGNIVAMVGKIGEKDGNLIWNYATGKRQVGSSIKPLTAYAPALDAGTITPATTFDNYPVRLLNGSPWPKNSPNTYTGWTSVRIGIQDSINTIALQAMESVGVEESYRFATENLKLGLVPDDMAPGALGMGGLTQGLNTVEMAAAYACFANNGVYNEPRTYLRVTRTDSSGQEVTVLENEAESHVAMKETTAYLMTDMLKQAATYGTGAASRFGSMPVAGKTGTTNKNFDRYFVGYTPYYVAAVWTGYDQNEAIYYKPPAGTSSNPSLAMWKKVMQKVHENLPVKNFELSSSGLETVVVCADSGKRCTDACSADVRGTTRAFSFLVPAGQGPGPDDVCPLHKMVDYCTEGHCLATESCPPECVVQKGVLDYIREDYGPGVKASDDAYLLVNMEKALEPTEENPLGGCPAHNGLPPAGEEDPENPLNPGEPTDPENPEEPFVPLLPPSGGSTTPSGGDSHEGYGGGPTTPTTPVTPVTPPAETPEPTPTPEEPAEPTPPSQGEGNWFDDLWNNA